MCSHGAQRDHEAAVRYLRQAAEAGDADAMAHLGHIYANGVAVPQVGVWGRAGRAGVWGREEGAGWGCGRGRVLLAPPCLPLACLPIADSSEV